MFLFTTQTIDSSNTNVVDQATEQLSAWQNIGTQLIGIAYFLF